MIIKQLVKRVILLVISISISILCFGILNAQKINKEDLYYITQAIIQDKIKTTQNQEKTTLEQGTIPTPKASSRNKEDGELVVAEAAEAESEIHAAINPLDSNNIVVAAMRYWETPNGPLEGFSLAFPIYYTNDFGQTWQKSEFEGLPPNFNSAGGGDPILVFDESGKVHLFWLLVERIDILNSKSKMAWATSEDGGATWTMNEDVDSSDILTLIIVNIGRFVDKEWAVADYSPDSPYRGNIYFSYTNINLEALSQSYEIWFKKKTFGSNNFTTTPIVIANLDFGFVHFSSLDVDADGNIHILFFGQRPDEENFALFHCKSVDGGDSFSTPIKISNVHLPCFPPSLLNTSCDVVGIDLNRMYPCNHLRADKSNGPNRNNLYITWTADGIDGQDHTGLDVYFSRSTDGGTTWDAPITLNDDATENTATHNFFSSLAVTENGAVGAAWYDRRVDPNNLLTDYYMAWSNDGGQTFDPNFSLTSNPADFSVIGADNAGLGIGEYNHIVTTPNGAMVFWGDGRNNDGNVNIYAQYVSAGQQLTTSLSENILVSEKFRLENLYPNPSMDALNLNLSLTLKSDLQLEVFNELGRQQWNDVQKNVLGQKQLAIDVSTYATGTYFLKITSKYGYVVRKFSVSR